MSSAKPVSHSDIHAAPLVSLSSALSVSPQIVSHPTQPVPQPESIVAPGMDLNTISGEWYMVATTTC